MKVYKDVCTIYGHITVSNSDNVVKLDKEALKIFLQTIGSYEKQVMEEKLSKKESYFPDPLVLECAKQNVDGTFSVDVELYKERYWNTKFEGNSRKKICLDFIEGMQWVLSYYTKELPSWKWFYPYHYAPPASSMAMYVDDFEYIKYPTTHANLPFQQLLMILPPKSAYLLPQPLSELLENPNSPLKKYCPEKFEIDLYGKRKEWEGLVLICNMNEADMIQEYNKLINKVDKIDLARNILGKTFLYKYNPEMKPQEIIAYLGNIQNCQVQVDFFPLVT